MLRKLIKNSLDGQVKMNNSSFLGFNSCREDEDMQRTPNHVKVM